jgi:hypothetical protein
LDFLAELKRWFDGQDGGESSVISCVLSPYLLTIYYRGETVGSSRATREGARWHGRHEEDATTVVLRDVYDAIVQARAVSLCARCQKSLKGYSRGMVGVARYAMAPHRLIHSH